MNKAPLLVLLFWCVTLPVWADYTPDPRYVEADKLLRGSRYVKSREIGEQMLKENPNSFEAQAIIGRVQLYGEGNPGKADYYLRKAHKTIVSRFDQPSTAEGPWRCYGDVLWSLRAAAMDLEDYSQAMSWIDEYNEAFPPGLPELYGWPLMKLGRMEKARVEMERAKETVKEDPDALNNVLNTIGAVEYEAGNYQESLDTFAQIITRVEQGQGTQDAVYYSNAAEAARDLLDLPAAEKYLLKSTQQLGKDSYSTPWLDLAEIYIGQARQPEALQALRRHSRHLASCEPGVQNQKRAESLGVLGLTLMACGYDLEAADLLSQVALHGDRNSATSTKRSLVRSRNHFFYREALKQKRERIREQRSYSGSSEWFKLYWQELALGQKMEAARRECAALALENGGPDAMIAPYGPNGFNCPWLSPNLREIFGPGVVAVQADRILEKVPVEAKPYVQAVLAEAKGDEELMQEALESLPPSQMLLRGRLYALLARETGSAQTLQQALEADPPVIRRLSMSLPVSIECQDSTLAKQLKSSPRFHGGEGFELSVNGDVGSGFSGQMRGPDGSVLASFSSAKGEDAAESRRLLAEELHKTVFAPRVDLSQSDINGLDGSNLAGGHFREQLQELVGAKPQDKSRQEE